ncbi:TDT malic acid transporter [Schizosaccharomyces cryophilus OY26]|uniref:TDT malic acid transporter n=1 Tax=Schizosaccharomyces cryophilus (strain OY26 / ATCC MYA-4695 / CBS 11777 / NBRC 106824 / NRRL Y48691) TaxID=653667 RepID=S9VQ02_SCHCR|nr:TDT malic acid transporter [Schizosaccharomyces cryophilus OY26]EPY50038.1 TDT malic acid transporter [Schizosaccharomyces cryophilus OY26]
MGLLKQRYHELLDLRVRGERLPIARRLQHFTWAWFASTMGTGGIGMITSLYYFRFHGLNTLGKIIFVFQLCIFSLFTVCILFRFLRYRGTFRKAWNNPGELVFMPTFLLSIATIISNFYPYAYPYTGEWMVWTIRITYWIYVACACIFCVSSFYTLFRNHPFRLNTIIPALILPIFPCMICGVAASAIVESQPPEQAKNMIVAGIAFQGLGFWIYLLVYGNNILRLFTAGLQAPADRPGMFIFVSPPSYTGLTLLDLAFGAVHKHHPIFVTKDSPEWLLFICSFFALFMIGLGIFNFVLALVSVIAGFCSPGKLKFKVSWFAMIFANGGLVMVIQELGKAINSKALDVIGQVCGVIITIVWICLIILAVRAVYVQELLYPGKDEDVGILPPDVLEYYEKLESFEKDGTSKDAQVTLKEINHNDKNS